MGLSIPIFNGWQVNTNVANAKIALENAQLELQNEKLRLYASINQAYADAVGTPMSSDSLRRITEGWGRRVAEQQQEAAERANAPAQRGESPQERRLDEVRPIPGQANVSTDGGMVLIRDEGWKEAKLTTISAVEVKPAMERPAKEE